MRTPLPIRSRRRSARTWSIRLVSVASVPANLNVRTGLTNWVRFRRSRRHQLQLRRRSEHHPTAGREDDSLVNYAFECPSPINKKPQRTTRSVTDIIPRDTPSVHESISHPFWISFDPPDLARSCLLDTHDQYCLSPSMFFFRSTWFICRWFIIFRSILC